MAPRPPPPLNPSEPVEPVTLWPALTVLALLSIMSYSCDDQSPWSDLDGDEVGESIGEGSSSARDMAVFVESLRPRCP